MNELIANIEKIHTTKLGVERIKRNLSIETDDVIEWCKAKISDENTVIKRIGKNWYATYCDFRITVNAHSFTIITAHKVKESNKGSNI